MEGSDHLPAGTAGAPDESSVFATVAAFRAAGRRYVEVTRPALAGLERRGRGASDDLAAGAGEAILADVVAGLPPRSGVRARVATMLSWHASGIEAVDGSVATGFLERGGWTVERLSGDDGPAGDGAAPAPGLPRGTPIELAVAVAGSPADASWLASVCTALRRLADPPVILLCDFSGRAEPRAADAALGADAVVRDPDELVRCAAERLPGPGRRRWGVGLSRTGRSLTLAPTGRLDATSAGRLAEVALTRRGTFTRLVVDLRDLAEIDPAGVRALADWRDLWPADEIELVLVTDRSTRARLGRCDLAVGWPSAGTAGDPLSL